MIGGLSKAASRLALAAILGAVGAVVLVQKPVRAADLGGDCCADLEERVAELEATTVRKGNKKVSITVYGKMNRAVLFWNDGAEKGVYSVDNSYESSRFGFKGSAKITGDWSAGYKLEAETRAAASEAVNQIDDDNGTRSGGTLGDEGRLLLMRQSFMYLDNKKLGQLRWGLTSMPKDDVNKDTDVTELADTMTSDDHMNRGFFLRPKGFDTEVGGPGQLKWQAISQCYSSSSAFDCSTRRNAVTYWSPSFFGSADGKGLTASWGWGENDIWSAALRYRDSWGPNWEFGAGAAYEKSRDENQESSGGGLNGFKRDINEWAGSASIKHKPTGLFAFGAFSTSETNDSNRQNAGVFTGTSSPDMSAWDARIGIQRKMGALGSLGDSSFFGGYLQIEDGIGGACGAKRSCKAGTFPDLAIQTEITGAEVTRWYLGYDQAIDSAAMHLYAVYEHLEPSVDLVNSSLSRVNEPLDNFDLFYTGARMYF
jgi:predicted porin